MAPDALQVAIGEVPTSDVSRANVTGLRPVGADLDLGRSSVFTQAAVTTAALSRPGADPPMSYSIERAKARERTEVHERAVWPREPLLLSEPHR